MTTPDERAVERDLQQHELSHAGCNERYWRGKALRAENAANHFFHCRSCRRGAPCEEGEQIARVLGLIARPQGKEL